MKKIVKLDNGVLRLREIINDTLRGQGVSFVDDDIIIEEEVTITTDNGCKYHAPINCIVIGNDDTGEVEDNSEIIDDQLDEIFESMDRNGEEMESHYVELIIRKRIKIS